MKKTVSSLLAAVILTVTMQQTYAETAQAIPVEIPKRPPGYTPPVNNGGVLLGVIVVGITLYLGGCIVIKLYRKDVGDEYTPHIYVLERSYDHVNYTGVCTNRACLPAGSKPGDGIGLFSDYRRDFTAFYRVRDDGPVQ